MSLTEPSPPPPSLPWYLAHGGHREGLSPDTLCVQAPDTGNNGSPDRKFLWHAEGKIKESQ